MPKNDHKELAVFVSQMLKGRKLMELASLFHLLSDPTRLRIVCVLLTEGKKSVNELVRELGVRQPVASNHLGLLRRHGLLEGVRAGHSIFYSIAK